MKHINAIHHISAIVGNAQENLNFYRNILGLKLIKQTLNFEDSSVYHLYFSNETMSNNFVMTFFPWERNFLGRKGSGQIGRIAFRIPKGSMKEWEYFLYAKGVETKRTQLFGRDTLEFSDFHTLDLALVESEKIANSRSILGFHGTVILSAKPSKTQSFLEKTIGVRKLSNTYYETLGDQRHVIIVPNEILPNGRWGIGTVHHLAWSLPNDSALTQWQEKLYQQQWDVTQVKDRKYFKSIYVIEKGNVIFEFATDGPGFQVDESYDELGKTLQIPPHFESQKQKIIEQLPKLNLDHA